MDHHAYLTYASSLDESAVPSEFHQPSVDVQHLYADRLGIDEARALQTQSATRAVAGGQRTFVVVAKAMTLQAQNALLKLFEEPPAETTFYLVLAPGADLIPTLRSRLQPIVGLQLAATNEAFASFVAASYADRLAVISEKTKAKDTQWMRAILSGAATQADSLAMRTSALLAVRYAEGPGASKKMLLEELALSLPRR